MKVTYYHNNSGGSWWLTNDDWKTLEKSGWVVKWEEERVLGALATSATIEAESVEKAIELWGSALPHMDAYEMGCPCCGPPHGFYSW